MTLIDLFSFAKINSPMVLKGIGIKSLLVKKLVSVCFSYWRKKSVLLLVCHLLYRIGIGKVKIFKIG